MDLTSKIITLSQSQETPFLVLDILSIKNKYREIKKNLSGIEVFYAMKANNDPKILGTLKEEDCGFEIASKNELNELLKLGVSSDKIMCMHTIKSPDFIRELNSKGISLLAVDSYAEIDKIYSLFPSALILIRLEVENTGSDWPLTDKFGVNFSQALDLLNYSNNKGLTVYGITFHVGSQCRNLNNWQLAIELSSKLFNEAVKMGAPLKMLSLGGGLPIKQIENTPSLVAIGKVIASALKDNFNSDVRVSIEPGRGMVGDSGVMVSTVLGKAERNGKNWIYIDAGVFNALMETIEGYKYSLKVQSTNKTKRFNIGGPSCDSIDIPFKDIVLPDLEIGDKLFILNAGAYTTVYASDFNGFKVPSIVYV